MSLKENYDQCKKCDEEYMNRYDAKYEWCKSCSINYLKKNFTNWTSENERIDNLIKDMQLEISELDDIIFEWIPYNQFDDIKEKGEEDFNKMYSAIWKDGPLNYNIYKNDYKRNQNKKVSLKLYNNFQNIINEFFNDQVKKYSITYISKVLKMCGISQCPNTKDYIIIFQDIYCEKCGKKYTNIIEEWCESCQINYFRKNFTNRTSGNEKVDNLIQEIQLKLIDYNKYIMFEWIPYDQLNDIEEIVKDDLHTLYSATWKDGPLSYNGKWTRESDKVVTLKYLYNSQNIIEFLNEIKNKHSIYSIYYDYYLVKIYGITQNPDIANYIIVFPNIYCKKCGKQYKDQYDAKYEWCKQCKISNLKENFTNWTSGNEKIDNLIQEMQLKINDRKDIVLKWIPYNQFNDIKEKDSSGFYSAIWEVGNMNKRVTLKSYNSQNITDEFLNEVKKDLNKNYGKIYGISQDSYKKDYFMVFRKGYNEDYCNLSP